ncbi:MAG: hypothetical protein WCO10_01175 [bacterium]
MSLFSFSNLFKKKYNYSLVYDIRGGSVGVSIVKFVAGPGFDVLKSVRQPISISNNISTDQYIRQMGSALEKASAEIQKHLIEINLTRPKAKIRVDRGFIFFSSPWSASQTMVYRYTTDNDTIITPSFLDKIFKEESAKLRSSLSGAKIFTDINSVGDVIEKKIIQAKINGYVMEDILNKPAQDLELSIYLTVVPQQIISQIENSISRHFIVDEYYLHSLSLPLYTVTRDLYPHKDDFVLVEIGYETTEIMIVRDKVIAGHASIPMGRNFFIKEVASKMKVGPEIANSMISLHCKGECDAGATAVFGDTLKSLVDIWSNKIKEVFSKYIEEMYIPKSVFFVADNDFICYVAEHFTNSKVDQYGIMASELKVLLIEKNQLSKICGKTTAAQEDMILHVEQLFLDKIYNI